MTPLRTEGGAGGRGTGVRTGVADGEGRRVGVVPGSRTDTGRDGGCTAVADAPFARVSKGSCSGVVRTVGRFEVPLAVAGGVGTARRGVVAGRARAPGGRAPTRVGADTTGRVAAVGGIAGVRLETEDGTATPEGAGRGTGVGSEGSTGSGEAGGSSPVDATAGATTPSSVILEGARREGSSAVVVATCDGCRFKLPDM